MQIKKLELYTQNLIEQKKFYAKVLGLDIVKEEEGAISFKIGTSILKLVFKNDADPYHFAFNIPSNQIIDALNWLKERVTILDCNTKAIQHFDFWDAKAIYFYDADSNIVELIARNTQNVLSNTLFSVKSLLSISEIGLPTDNIKQVYELLKESTAIPVYSGSFEQFLAIGNEEGLLIVIDKQQKKEWFPTNDSTCSSDFKMDFIEKGKKYNLNYTNEHLVLSAH